MRKVFDTVVNGFQTEYKFADHVKNKLEALNLKVCALVYFAYFPVRTKRDISRKLPVDAKPEFAVMLFIKQFNKHLR